MAPQMLFVTGPALTARDLRRLAARLAQPAPAPSYSASSVSR